MDRTYVGEISIACDFYKNHMDELAEVLARLRFVPVRVECRYDRGDFRLIGCSPFFRVVSPSVVPPRYEIEVTKDEEGKVSGVAAKWIRRDSLEQGTLCRA